MARRAGASLWQGGDGGSHVDKPPSRGIGQVSELCLNCNKETPFDERGCTICGVSRRVNRFMRLFNLPDSFLENKIKAITRSIVALGALLGAVGGVTVAWDKIVPPGPEMSRASIAPCGFNCITVSFMNSGKGPAKIGGIEIVVETIGLTDTDKQLRAIDKTPTMADLETDGLVVVPPNTTWRHQFVNEEFKPDFYPEALPDPTIIRSCQYYLTVTFVDDGEAPLKAKGPCF